LFQFILAFVVIISLHISFWTQLLFRYRLQRVFVLVIVIVNKNIDLSLTPVFVSVFGNKNLPILVKPEAKVNRKTERAHQEMRYQNVRWHISS